MAALEESSSESEREVKEVEVPRGRRVGARRRRVFPTHSVTTVPIYSGRVNRTLRLYRENAVEVDRELWTQVNQSDSEEDLNNEGSCQKRRRVSPGDADSTPHTSGSETERENGHSLLLSPRDGSPSPPSSPSLPTQRTRRAVSAIREVNQKLRDLADFRGSPPRAGSGDMEDVVLVGPRTPVLLSPRLLTLKLRCRGRIHRVPLRVTDPLQTAVDQLASRLQVDAAQLLLLQQEREVPLGETPESRNLGIADILDCLVMSDTPSHGEADMIRLQVRGHEKDSLQTITVGKGEPLRTLMGMYKERTGLQRCRVCFLFDGAELSESSTPRELDMEPDDVIDARVCTPCGV